MDEREERGKDGGMGTVSWCPRHDTCLSCMPEGWDLRWCLMRVRRADRDGPAKAASNPQRTAGGRRRGVSGVTPSRNTLSRLSGQAVHARRRDNPRLDFVSSGSVSTLPHPYPFPLLFLSKCRFMIHLTKRLRFAANAQLLHDSTSQGSSLSAQGRDSVGERPLTVSRVRVDLLEPANLPTPACDVCCALRFIDAASRKTKLA